MKRWVSLLILSLVFLTGCSNWYGSGYVLEKTYRAPYSSLTYCGKTCWVPTHHAACYRLRIQADDGTQQEECVRPAFWEESAVGEHITITKGEN